MTNSTLEACVAFYAGKARPNSAAPHPWHSVSYHSLDVAAACLALIEARPGLLHRLCDLAGFDMQAGRAWLLVAAALHDLGKFADGWQAKLGLNLPRQPEPFAANLPAHDHAAAGPWLWEEGGASAPFAERFGEKSVARFTHWLRAAAGHHGTPTNELAHRLAISEQTKTDARMFVAAILDLISPPHFEVGKIDGSLETWPVAGIVTLADWLGSNQEWFPYQPPDTSLADYWNAAQERARLAIREAGFGRGVASAGFTIADALGEHAAPTALQAWAAEVEIPAARSLAILEDLTGSGKTEAGLVLAHRMMLAGHGAGLYFALPTMATATAMFGRMQRYADLMFEPGANRVLAHAATDLADMFLAPLQANASESDYPADLSSTASAEAASWIADERRKAFLAEIGVGTIDQALMISLPTKFQPVRAAALADRILIVDEAHSFDAYTTTLLEKLLEFQATLGGSAIILSATLTGEVKSKLLRAFAQGSGPEKPGVGSQSFPLATIWSARTGLNETACESQRGTRRDLPVVRLPDVDRAAEKLLAAARAGGCGVWVRNTVQDAMDATAMLRDQAGGEVQVELFHSRFTIGDRAAIERHIVERFGKAGDPNGRKGRILVGTQVLEQSLDVDFDVMVADLAPLDLLIQRAGRLQRHDRPNRAAPVLHVLAPDPALVEGNWYAKMFPRAAYVYADHGKLHRGLQCIEGGLNLLSASPRELLESALGEGAVIHKSLSSLTDEALIRRHAERITAASACLKPHEGYCRGQHWRDEDVTKTRLADETRTLRLARWDGARLRPWSDYDDEHRAWRLSEISVKLFRADARPPIADAALEKAIAAIEAAWGKRGKEILLIPLTKQDGFWRGATVGRDGEEVRLVYCAELGLRYER